MCLAEVDVTGPGAAIIELLELTVGEQNVKIGSWVAIGGNGELLHHQLQLLLHRLAEVAVAVDNIVVDSQ